MTNTQRSVMQQTLDALGAGQYASILMNTGGIIQNLCLALSEALADPVEEPVPVGEVVAYTDNRLQFKRIRSYDGAIDELPIGAKVYASPPVEHLCKWPTCQTEEYQKNLEDQIAQELAGKPQAEVPLLTRDEIWGIWNMEIGVDEMDQHEAFKFALYIEQAVRQKAGL